MPTVKAASAVHVAANASWARKSPGFRAVAEKARADAASRFLIQAGAAVSACVTREAEHGPLTFCGRPADAPGERGQEALDTVSAGSVWSPATASSVDCRRPSAKWASYSSPSISRTLRRA